LKKTPKHKKHQTPNNNTNKKTHKKQKNTTPNQTTTSKPTELLGLKGTQRTFLKSYHIIKKFADPIRLCALSGEKWWTLVALVPEVKLKSYQQKEFKILFKNWIN
ncbi:hypothetical protein CUJ83_10690, partial [Methanocella sp. CWC-04]